MKGARVVGWQGAFAAWLLLCACAGPAMKVPPTAGRSVPWKIAGYSERAGLRERDFVLGVHSVRRIRRIRKPVMNATRATEPVQRGYSYELGSGEPTLQAQCEETIDPRRLSVVRFGVADVHLDCACHERGRALVELALVDGAGSLRLSDGTTYKVRPLHTSASGSRKLDVLGYRFDGASGAGALERTGGGRAWPPAQLDERAARELACAYAALLLYRPEW